MSRFSKLRPGRSISADNPPPSRPPPVLCRPLDLTFTQKAEPLGNIAQNLPRVVLIDQTTVPMTTLPFNACQPLLLYQKRCVVKAGALSVFFDKEKGQFVETGDFILVPQDYPGWFGVLGSPKDLKSNVHIPYYRSVSKLALAGCKDFLIGGTNSINGITRLPDNREWVECKLLPGAVLRKGGMYQERRRQNTRKGLLGKKNTTVVVDFYLGCFDSEDREILLPANQEGVFYALTQEGAPVKTPVLRMHDILQRYKFPLVVKLLYGSVPETVCAFKDTLLLTESATNLTVIASTIENMLNINLEIPLDNDMMFFAAEHNASLTLSRQYIQALKDCEAKAPSYMRNMKVLVGATSDENLPPQPEEEIVPSNSEDTPAKNEDTVSTEENHAPTLSTEENHVSLRNQKSTNNTSQRNSRLSVLSKIITVNSDRQSIFAPSVPLSPVLSQSQRRKHGKDGKTTSIPKSVELTDGFERPKTPETIPSNNRREHPKTAISEEGLKKLQAFQKSRQDAHTSEFDEQYDHYERPNPLMVPNQVSEDLNTYGSVWNSSSMNRESAAGIRIESKPGRPTTSPSGQPFPISKSTPEGFPFFQMSRQQSNRIRSDPASEGDTTPSSEGSPLPRESACASETHNNHPYDAMSTETVPYYRHVYSELYGGQQGQFEEKTPPHDLKSAERARFTGQNSSTEEFESVNGGYLSPLETNLYATYISHSIPSDVHDQATNILRATDQTKDGFVFYEIDNTGPAAPRPDSGISEGGDSAGEDPSDHYDRPLARSAGSLRQDADPHPTYATPNSEPLSLPTMMSELQLKIKEKSEGKNALSLPSPTGNASSVSRMAATPLSDHPEPPPLPQNHPSRGIPSRSAVSLIRRIPNLAPPPPKKSNRAELTAELKKVGLKMDSELAFLSLQAADLVMLAQRGDDLEDTLVKMLPQICQLDLKKIALCIKKMGIRLVND